LDKLYNTRTQIKSNETLDTNDKKT